MVETHTGTLWITTRTPWRVGAEIDGTLDRDHTCLLASFDYHSFSPHELRNFNGVAKLYQYCAEELESLLLERPLRMEKDSILQYADYIDAAHLLGKHLSRTLFAHVTPRK